MLGSQHDHLGDTDTETDELIELQTLPYSGRRKRQEVTKMATQKRKGGLGRIFGAKKNGTGTKNPTGR